MLRIENITKIYKNKNKNTLALKDIDLTLPDTGLISIIGQSGCGKTTLLNLIGLIDTPTNGKVIYNGIEFDNENEDYIRNKVVTTVFQEDMFFHELTVGGNIRVALEVQDNYTEDGKTRNLLNQVGLESKYEVYPSELSTGQKQRVTLTRSLAREFDILLADEPTANLDEKTELLIFKILKSISEHKLVLLVTHNKNIANLYSDRIIEIHDGEIIYDVNNSLKRDISIDISDDIVYVSNDTHTDINDWAIIKKLVLEKKEILLRLDSKEHNCEQNEAIPYNETALLVPTKTKLSFSFIKFLSTNIIKNQKMKFLMTYLFFGFMLTLLTLIVYFADFSVENMTHDAFRNNGIKYSNYIYFEEFEPRQISDFVLEEMINSTGSEIRALSNFDEEILVYDIPSHTNFNYFERPDSYYIKGLSFVSEEEVDIIIGVFPVDNQVMITDYTADRIISASDDWQDYSDIVGEEIEYLNFSYVISGIIDTDMERFEVLRDVFETEDLIAREFDTMCNDIYQRFYVPKDLKEKYQSLDSVSLVIDRGSSIIQLSKIEDGLFNLTLLIDFQSEDSVQNGIYISKSLYDLYLIEESYGVNNPYIYIGNNIYDVKGVISDNLDNQEHLVYAENEMYIKIINEYFSTDEVLVEVSSKDIVEYMHNHGFEHQTHISDEINTIINFIDVIQSLLISIMVVIIVILTIAVIANQHTINKFNKKRWALLRMMGMEVKHFILKMQYYHLLSFLIETILVILLSYISIYTINNYIRNTLDLNLEIISIKISNLIIIILVYLLLTSLISYIMTKWFLSRKIIDLIKE